jgi:CubicO group peptidase (beta-lactamase class C family)
MDSQKIPAASVLIFKGNTILHESYLGKSNLKKNISIEADHLFLLASISKVITATALLQLHEKGLFSLQDATNGYLPFVVENPNFTTPITFQMLLTHTSGIADGTALDNQYYYDKDSPISLRYFLENYLVPEGEFYNASENFHNYKPGTRYEYSNEGNALIRVLVEEISGVDFNTYCKQNIFTPLGMTNTHWRLDEISQTIVQPHNYSKRQYKEIPHYTFTDYLNGGLRSTATDLFKFLSAFTQGGKANNYQLLNLRTIDAMVTPQIPALDKEMGLHLFLINAQYNLWGHDSSEQGVATIVAFNPTTRVGVIILTNQGDADLDDILVTAYKFGLKL